MYFEIISFRLILFIEKIVCSGTFWVSMMKRLWPKYFVLPLEKRDVHVCNFEAIWSGNWAAAYFRYCRIQIIYFINWRKLVQIDFN